MNFLTWIRESVKRAVMLGLADAVEHLGQPGENDEAGNKLLAVLRQPPTILEARPTETMAAGLPRKRLGKSLEQLQQGQTATT